MGRIRTGGSSNQRWVAAVLLGLAVLAGSFVWRFSGALTGAALSGYSSQVRG